MKESLFLSFYNLLYPLGGVLFSPYLVYKLLSSEKYRAGIEEKLSLKLPLKDLSKKRIWIHAVSVGEVLTVMPLVKRIRESIPGTSIVFSTTTLTGMSTAKDKLSHLVDLFLYFPLDFYPITKRVVKALSPSLVLVVETEIWPSFLHILGKESVPVFMVNGRISDSSFAGYLKLSLFMRDFLKKYELMFVRSSKDAARLVVLGADPKKIRITGNLKYVSVYERAQQLNLSNLKKEIGWEEFPIFCAGSTHPKEEEIVLKVFKRLKVSFPDLRLILAPRHPERKTDVIRLVKDFGFSYSLRSENKKCEEAQVLILDTVGELMGFYSISDVVFVGGSFVDVGGHNPLEPLVFGKPVAMGPFFHNFSDIIEDMGEAIKVVKNESELFDFVLKTLKGSFNLPLDKVMKKFNLSLNSVEYIIDEVKRRMCD